jgi:phosphoribosylformylglycinamidine synthase
MDIATIAMKELKKRGKLEDLDESEEINACSIVVDVELDGKKEEWLVMFKNETHNHPTEIEPFGGAATCLGGAIRDPLSGRSFVYQAMRVTGSGDPRTKVEDTLTGKLPQRKITTVAAEGYSSYGNQIGIATGQVAEFYDENFIAKRMEIGAVIAAAPKKNVIRKKPVSGDIVVLVGGRTGRDGIGGATGSSKEHTEESLVSCGAEVQKGNPPTERKIQRLFRHSAVSKMIKRCNDFGAGGVSVAIGELTDGLEINLDVIPKKYEGLDGTELAISESQERMAVVISRDDLKAFSEFADVENLEATVVADVTDDKRLKMFWRNKAVVNISRDFLNTNGVKQKTSVKVLPPSSDNYFNLMPEEIDSEKDLKKAWLKNLSELNNCSQKGLIEQFDSTIGAGTVLMPLGGKYQLTPAEGMAAKIPVLKGDTSTATIMTFGYNPKLAKWSPYHGAMYAVIEAAAKSAALGGSYKRIRLSLQEYFEKLGQNDEKWGKPFSALLGAFYAQKELGIPAIGGKDSMSGTFKDLNVPPTLVAFAVNTGDVNKIISQEFKKVGSKIILIPLVRKKDETPDFKIFKKNLEEVTDLIQNDKVLASYTVKGGGLAEAVSKMCFGNRIGMAFNNYMEKNDLFKPGHGSIILEIKSSIKIEECLKGINYKLLGHTQEKEAITVNNVEINLKEALTEWEKTLEKIFPTRIEKKDVNMKTYSYDKRKIKKSVFKIAKPNVFIPVFPGTNCEYDTSCAFEKAGGKVETFVFRNLSSSDIENSIKEVVRIIKKSQIIMIPGGFSAGDEPEGSGKFIAAVFRNPFIREAVMELLEKRDGLILGICNGFQALIKLGLLPYGEIRDINENSPTLTFNEIGRHVSHMVQTKIVSNLSPWLSNANIGDIHMIPISHGEGRFIANEAEINMMMENGQISTQYVNDYNLNGSINNVEGITSPDGRILGKMGHSERIGANVAVNVPGNKDQRIFEAGINYFK